MEAEDYQALKGFFAWMLEHVIPAVPGLAAEEHPLAVMARMEKSSPARASQGLRMAIGDFVEDTQGLSGEQVKRIDHELAAAGLPTLSQVRARFWSKVKGIMKRGKVRSETEYYALRNVVEAMPESESPRGWELLAEYERMALARADAGKGT